MVVMPVFQITEELDKVKQEMEEKGSSMSDGGETPGLSTTMSSWNDTYWKVMTVICSKYL